MAAAAAIRTPQARNPSFIDAIQIIVHLEAPGGQ
jgi:hypothetical protein